ncbi:hypothetical protein PIB30_031711 [Stylosanthes scabra]|uniref:ENT domain-containing protein n=1 Tax=Stylosanthes scabra TaxID=79078 RepID=A0ABU6SC77_9FABA|nr:hypothetical protein [Stylosanthes scabra]
MIAGTDDDLPPTHQNRIPRGGGRLAGNGRSAEKEGLITELKKELRLSNEEHIELLSRVNADDVIRRIRAWRQTGGRQRRLGSSGPALHDSNPSPTVSAAHKKAKKKPSGATRSLGVPSSSFHPQPLTTPHQPSSSGPKRGSVIYQIKLTFRRFISFFRICG